MARQEPLIVSLLSSSSDSESSDPSFDSESSGSPCPPPYDLKPPHLSRSLITKELVSLALYGNFPCCLVSVKKILFRLSQARSLKHMELENIKDLLDILPQWYGETSWEMAEILVLLLEELRRFVPLESRVDFDQMILFLIKIELDGLVEETSSPDKPMLERIGTIWNAAFCPLNLMESLMKDGYYWSVYQSYPLLFEDFVSSAEDFLFKTPKKMSDHWMSFFIGGLLIRPLFLAEIFLNVWTRFTCGSGPRGPLTVTVKGWGPRSVDLTVWAWSYGLPTHIMSIASDRESLSEDGKESLDRMKINLKREASHRHLPLPWGFCG